MSKNKFEQLIELIINEDEEKAKALFHKIVVEKSRDIYEGLEDEEMGGETFGDEIEDHEDVIDGDEMGDDEFAGDEMGDDEFAGDDMGDEGLEDRVMDLEDAIDELKAEFDELMGGDGDADDFGGDADGDADDMGIDMGDDFDSDEGEDTGELDDEVEIDGDKKFGEASIYGESRKSPADLMREYVEKVGQDWPKGASEGDEVGASGKKQPINSKSNVISGKNDMGGTTANIAKGGTASDKDSNTGPKKPSNAYTKGEKKMGQDKYENSPAANTKGYKDKQQAKTKEGSDTAGTQSVDKKSFNPGGKSGFRG